MDNLNLVMVEGNVSRKPKVRTNSKTGERACLFSVGVNRSFKKEGKRLEEVSFFDIAAYKSLVKVCENFLSVGKAVRIRGRLKQDRYQSSEGKPESNVFIIAEQIELGSDRTMSEAMEAGIFDTENSADLEPAL